MQELSTEVLVVGGGTGGTAAAIQAARSGAKTILVSEFPWLGGMLTAAGVAVPDGNELEAWQTGIWGEFLAQLRRRQPEGLDHSWVSLFSFDPRLGAEIFADWVKELPNLQWIWGETPQKVLRRSDRICGVEFTHYRITAQITLDGTELGDLLPLGEIPHRWGWEFQAEFNEPSAPVTPNHLTANYPVQSLTWVAILQDFQQSFGEDAPEISTPPIDQPELFEGAWQNYGPEKFLNYGRLPGNRFMLNWPIHGNDYGEGMDRLLGSATEKRQLFQEALWRSQSFARQIQQEMGRRYGLANLFPQLPDSTPGGGGFALMPYFRESRRLKGLRTLTEGDILPIPGGKVAKLHPETIAFGNYANDHHYPGGDYPLQPKSIRWGGRWTGTPFTIPYGCLVPETVDGFLCCDKNISVSHIANGASRLQPVVLGIGQAAGLAAALCIQGKCQPRDLPISQLQTALVNQQAALVPLFNLPPSHPEWHHWQNHYLQNPDRYPAPGNCPAAPSTAILTPLARLFHGTFQKQSDQNYVFQASTEERENSEPWQIITTHPTVNEQLSQSSTNIETQVWGRLNPAGNWLLVEQIPSKSKE